MRMKIQKSLLNISMLMKNLLLSLATNLNTNLHITIILNLNLIIIITRVIFMDTGYQSILDIINQDMKITIEVMMEDTMEGEDIMEEEDIMEQHLSQDLSSWRQCRGCCRGQRRLLLTSHCPAA